MDTSLDLKTFKDAVESMKRILKNGRPIKISVFGSAVATINEIFLKINDTEMSSEIKYNIDKLKTNFEMYEKFSSLSIGHMYLQRCVEIIESLDNLYRDFEAKTNKKRPRSGTTEYEPETFRAIRVSVYDDENYSNTSLTEHNQNEPDSETKFMKDQDEIVNNCRESTFADDRTENVFKVKSKSAIEDARAGPSANFKEITESKNENVFFDNPKYTPTKLEDTCNEFTILIQNEKVIQKDSSSVPSKLSSVEDEEFRRTTVLDTNLKEKAEDFANRADEISKLIEERENNERAYRELKLANEEFEKRQEALRLMQNEFSQKLTEILNSHQLLIREEFAELKNTVKDIYHALLATNKDLRQLTNSQDITIDLLKSDLRSLQTTMKEVLKQRDEKDQLMVNRLDDLLKAKDECRFCSNQMYHEESRDKGTKRTSDKILADEDLLEEI